VIFCAYTGASSNSTVHKLSNSQTLLRFILLHS
jgi:hypothetical protein